MTGGDRFIDVHSGCEVEQRESICIGVHDVRGIAMATHVAYTWSHDIVYDYGHLPRSCQIFSVYAKQLAPATTANLWPGQMTATGMQCRTSSYRQKIHALVIIADGLDPMHELPQLATTLRQSSESAAPVTCVLLDTTQLSNSTPNLANASKAARIKHAARLARAIDAVSTWAEHNKFMFSAFDAGRNLDMLDVFFHQVVFLARPHFQRERRERRDFELACQSVSAHRQSRGKCSSLVGILLRLALVNVGVLAVATAAIHARLWLDNRN